ncbi:unnamed protein product, partial [Ixodes pacificus]
LDGVDVDVVLLPRLLLARCWLGLRLGLLLHLLDARADVAVRKSHLDVLVLGAVLPPGGALFLLGLLQPLDERLGPLMDLLGHLLAHILQSKRGPHLLGDLLGPVQQHFLLQHVRVIQGLEDVGHPGQEGRATAGTCLLDTPKEVALGALVAVGEAQKEKPVVRHLAQHLVVEEQLAQHQGCGLQAHLEPLGLPDHLPGVQAAVPPPLDEVVEDVHPLLLALLQVVVQHQALGPRGESLHATSLHHHLGVLAGVLRPVVVGVVPPVVVLVVGLVLGLVAVLLGVRLPLALVPRLALALLATRSRRGGRRSRLPTVLQSTRQPHLARRRVLEDEGVELVGPVEGAAVAARPALGGDEPLALQHPEHRLGVVARGAQHVAADEAVQDVLQLGRLVGPVDDVAVVLGVQLRLGPQLATEVLGRVGGRPVQGLGHLPHVYQHRLDAVALALHL